MIFTSEEWWFIIVASSVALMIMFLIAFFEPCSETVRAFCNSTP